MGINIGTGMGMVKILMLILVVMFVAVFAIDEYRRVEERKEELKDYEEKQTENISDKEE